MRAILAGLVLGFALVGPVAAQELWTTLPHPDAMPEAGTSGTKSVNGIEMYYATYGGPTDGQLPVLLIHGGLGDADIWSAQVADLMRDHLVIVADSRGHGRSTRTREPFGYELMASDYLALLDALAVPKVDLVGWSDGGIIGLDIAMHHPERLGHLFAQAANITTDGVDPGVETDPVFGEYIDWMGEEYRKLSPTPDRYDDFVGQISAMWASQPNWSDAEVSAIHVPVAVVAGAYDEAIPRDHTDRIAGLIPGAVEIILPNVSHFAMLQAPGEYTAAVRSFFAR